MTASVFSSVLTGATVGNLVSTATTSVQTLDCLSKDFLRAIDEDMHSTLCLMGSVELVV